MPKNSMHVNPPLKATDKISISGAAPKATKTAKDTAVPSATPDGKSEGKDKDDNQAKENAAIMKSLKRLEDNANKKPGKSASAGMTDLMNKTALNDKTGSGKNIKAAIDKSPIAKDIVRVGKVAAAAPLFVAGVVASKTKELNKTRKEMSSSAGTTRQAATGAVQTIVSDKVKATGEAIKNKIMMGKPQNSQTTATFYNDYRGKFEKNKKAIQEVKDEKKQERKLGNPRL